jgi:hypothetical protein
MQIYSFDNSFTVGQSFTIGVQPDSRFSLAIYHQADALALTSFSGISIEATTGATSTHIGKKWVLQSTGSSAPKRFDEDWNWPTVTLKPKRTTTPATGAYVVIAYEVDAIGNPMTDLGQRIVAGHPVYGFPPDSNNMALVIGRPATPAAAIAYVIPIATYHAYNSTGGGCFYDDQIHHTAAANKVSLRRPGGGLGAQLGEPDDPYDTASPRQQFTHWDAKFIRWLIAQDIAVDFFTDIDLHVGASLNLANYKCMLSVGHHEYWSQDMRDRVSNFVLNGGNVAVFGGNACYRPVNFGSYRTPGFMREINKLADHWSNPDYNESQLLGLSYGFGGGKWGEWNGDRWVNMRRAPTGYSVQQASHWVFTGTGLSNDETFGDSDRLVGYEADGVPTSGNGFNVLAKSPRLTGWDVGGTAALGIYGTETSSRTKLVFNCGTTDWARILNDSSAASNAIVSRITRNVLRAFTGQSL